MASCLVLVVFDAYEKIAEKSIEDSIKSELSGDFERLMLAVGKKKHTIFYQPISLSAFFLGPAEVIGNVKLPIKALCHVLSHSPVHTECAHVLCQAPLLLNEGKYT